MTICGQLTTGGRLCNEPVGHLGAHRWHDEQLVEKEEVEQGASYLNALEAKAAQWEKLAARVGAKCYSLPDGTVGFPFGDSFWRDWLADYCVAKDAPGSLVEQ